MAFVINPDEVEGWPLHEGIEGKVVVNGQNMTALMATWAPKLGLRSTSTPMNKSAPASKGRRSLPLTAKTSWSKRGMSTTSLRTYPMQNGMTATSRRSFLSVFHPSGMICFANDSTRRLSALPSRSRNAPLLAKGRSKDKNR